jgi:hypothetical protein
MKNNEGISPYFIISLKCHANKENPPCDARFGSKHFDIVDRLRGEMYQLALSFIYCWYISALSRRVMDIQCIYNVEQLFVEEQRRMKLVIERCLCVTCIMS